MKQYKYFSNVKSINDIKETYKKLVKQYHPDLNPNTDTTETMKQINNEYEAILQDKNFINNLNTDNKKEYTQTDFTAYRDIINILIKMQNVKIEIIGSWIWLSGNTYSYKDTIKDLNFRWSTSKKMWYYFKDIENTQKTRCKTKNINDTRALYGSVILQNENNYCIA